MYEQVPKLAVHTLDEGHVIWTGCLPGSVRLSPQQVVQLWEMHPREYQSIMMHGKPTDLPRHSQAYGADYHYSGQTSKAEPVPEILRQPLSWVRSEIEPRANGVLVNWYDAALGHYIGAHRDSTKSMCAGAPIVTVSVGATRTMRIRRWKGKDRHDFELCDGSVVVIPFETNLAWTHEILGRKSDVGRRISVTFRAFEAGSQDNRSHIGASRYEQH
jgi:alkylated DNA repair dioxygenase AlkB